MIHCIRRTAPSHSKSGTLISTPIDSDRVTQLDTINCCHCGRVWAYLPGCGNKKRDFGYCMNCAAYHCGPGCETCVAMEQLIENMEAGLPFHEAKLHKPIRGAVSVSPGGILLGKG